MATSRAKKGKATFGQYGDIQATDPEGQALLNAFSIEVKNGYTNDSFLNMVDKLSGAAGQTWEKFVRQAKDDAKKAGALYWMLIWKRNRKTPLVFVPLAAMRSIALASRDRPFSKADFFVIPHLRGKVELKNGSHIQIYLTSLSLFLETIHPLDIQNMLVERENEQAR